MNKTQSFASSAILLLPFACGCGRNHEKPQPAADQKPVTQRSRDVKVTQGLVVQPISATTVRIHWCTNVVTDGVLRYGTRVDRLDQAVTESWAGVTHRVILTNLTPNTTYYYRVSTSSPQSTEPMSSAATFRTGSARQTR